MSDLNNNDDDRNILAIAAAADDEGLIIGLTTNIIYQIFPKIFAFPKAVQAGVHQWYPNNIGQSVEDSLNCFEAYDRMKIGDQ